MREVYRRVALIHEIFRVPDLLGELRDGLSHADLQSPLEDCREDQEKKQ